MDFWYFLISLRATLPGLNLWGFLTPEADGADLRTDLTVVVGPDLRPGND